VIEADIAEYETLADRLELLLQSSVEAQSTLTELGAGVWVDASIPDAKTVTLDLGLGVHADLPVHTAVDFVSKRVEVLRRKKMRHETKLQTLTWQIEQFQGAIANADPGPIIRASPGVL